MPQKRDKFYLLGQRDDATRTSLDPLVKFVPRIKDIERCPYYGVYKKEQKCMLPSGAYCEKAKKGATCSKDIERTPYTGWRKKKPKRAKTKRCKCK
jgi:hypothetical protein